MFRVVTMEVLPFLLLAAFLVGTRAAVWSQYYSGLLQAEELSLSLLGYSDTPATCCLGPGDHPLVPCSASYSPVVLQPEPCCDLLRALANTSAALADCLMVSARPLRPCQSCQAEYRWLQEQMLNVSLEAAQNTTKMGRCAMSLLQCDRMQLVSRLNYSFVDIWTDSNCAQCLNHDSEGLKNDSIKFMEIFKETMQCFDRNRLEMSYVPLLNGNFSNVCTNCSKLYKDLNGIYMEMEEMNTLCADIEDAMNSTWILWSQSFNCTKPCYDMVPVIAVSSFILFLPIVFYLSSFLHSEQKKRKLILPKRMKSATNLMYIPSQSS